MSENKPKQSAYTVEIDASHDGQRIDNYLLRALKNVPKSRVYRLLRKGEVRLNGGRIQPSQRLRKGDNVRIPPLHLSAAATPSTIPSTLTNTLERAVLLENEQFIVLDKPCGLAVHAGSGIHYGVIEALRQCRAQNNYLELGHRLDRETSGCLVIARDVNALRAFQQQLQAGLVEKRYLLLVRGQWPFGEHSVALPLRKSAGQGGERIVIVSEDGKAAESHFAPITLSPQASLLEARIITGRTHQIRVHAAHQGYPLGGDGKYGDAIFNRQLAQIGLQRLFLHAHRIAFSIADRHIDVSAPLPNELRQTLDQLDRFN